MPFPKWTKAGYHCRAAELACDFTLRNRYDVQILKNTTIVQTSIMLVVIWNPQITAIAVWGERIESFLVQRGI